MTIDLQTVLTDGQLLRRSGDNLVGVAPETVVTAGGGLLAGSAGALATQNTVTVYHDIYWTFPTTAVQGDAVKEVPAPRDGTIVEIEFSAGIAPVTASIIGDFNIDGTSVWNATPANRPTIATSTKVATGGALDTSSFLAGEMLQPVLDQLNASDAGDVGQILVRLTWSEQVS